MVTCERNLYNKKARSESVTPASNGRTRNANHHPDRIRIHPDYPVRSNAAILFIIAGILVCHGLSAGLVVRGYRS